MGSKSLIRSAIRSFLAEESQFILTRDDVEHLLNRWSDRDVRFRAEWVLDHWDEDYVQGFISQVSETGSRALRLLGPIPHLDRSSFIQQFFTGEDIFDAARNWPIVAYVSGGGEDTVGLEIGEDGTVKIFEGNDEASEATLDLVNRLTKAGDQLVRVWTSQPEEVVVKIKTELVVPAGIYVSPVRSHAEGYWAPGRELIWLKLPLGAMDQESELDWRVRREVRL